jgi:hypothetical protein
MFGPKAKLQGAALCERGAANSCFDLGAVTETDARKAGAAFAIQELGRRQRHGRRADEAGDERVGGPGVDLHRRADLLDAPVVHNHDPVGKRHRLGLIVSHHDEGGIDALPQVGQFEPGAHAQRRVEVRKRLVEQEQFGVLHDGAADRDPLPLPPRHLPRFLVEVGLDLKDSRRFSYPRLDLRRGTRALRRPNAIFSRTDMCG